MLIVLLMAIWESDWEMLSRQNIGCTYCIDLYFHSLISDGTLGPGGMKHSIINIKLVIVVCEATEAVSMYFKDSPQWLKSGRDSGVDRSG